MSSSISLRPVHCRGRATCAPSTHGQRAHVLGVNLTGYATTSSINWLCDNKQHRKNFDVFHSQPSLTALKNKIYFLLFKRAALYGSGAMPATPLFHPDDALSKQTGRFGRLTKCGPEAAGLLYERTTILC